MEELYSFVDTEDAERRALYVRGDGRAAGDGCFVLRAGEVADFFTYFNSFSLMKWRRYTSLRALFLRVCLEGEAVVEVVGGTASSEAVLAREVVTDGVQQIAIPENEAVLVGVRIEARRDCLLRRLAWCGRFDAYRPKRIGAVICTFRREVYVKRTMEVLRAFQETHDWLDVLVVDNGRTLPLVESRRFRVIGNPNYGGSGGFTRGMMEYVQRGGVDAVLLMDDDISLETGVLERMQSLLSGVRLEYAESFLGGAMLDMQHPAVQVENTGYWNGIRLYPLGRGRHLSLKEELLRNELEDQRENQYAAWWFCVMPLSRIETLGYPLPVFLKGDDMEYGMRNQRPLMCMNGIGVWHEAFEKKVSDVVNYFSDRNMLILNLFAGGCARWKTMVMIFGRLTKRLIRRGAGWGAVRMFSLALQDFRRGPEALTRLPADEKFALVKSYGAGGGTWRFFGRIFCDTWHIFQEYAQLTRTYRAFRQERLRDGRFWTAYLRLGMEEKGSVCSSSVRH